MESHADVARFAESETGGRKIVRFLQRLSDALKDVEGLEWPVKTDRLVAFRPVLEALESMCDATELAPKSNLQRFGNLAFRDFIAQCEAELPGLLQAALGKVVSEDDLSALNTYLRASLGNSRRVDYGSGHELNFIAALIVLVHDLGPELATDTCRELALGLFFPYIQLARKVQQKFQLEPAGSRGVWGLDDFQFVPFLLGSFQLIDAERRGGPMPADSAKRDMVEQFQDQYLYFNMIAHVMKHKGEHAPFHQTSPMLYDISGAESWHKMAVGFLRMFVQEVLTSFPVMQHFPLTKKHFSV